MGHVVFEDVWRVFRDGTQAIRSLNLEVADGELFVFLGPSGSGKTTLLRSVAGLDQLTSGRILLDGRDISEMSPKERNVAMIFQNYSLYPHMSVENNIAFGVQARNRDKSDVKERVERAARLLDLEPYLKKKPRTLSGGQQQRVAIARAIARDPALFLMDEPLSNLDARTRVTIRGELARIQREVGVTTLYVTHDQTEALALGDRIGILREGTVEQVAAPDVLYRSPRNLFVAGFVGSPPMNLAEATVEDADGELFIRFGGHRIPVDGRPEDPLRAYAWRQVVVGVRPENLAEAGPSSPGTQRMRVAAERSETIGSDVLVHFRVDAPLLLTEDPRYAGSTADESLPVERENVWTARASRAVVAGDTIELAIAPGALKLFDPRTGDLISG